VRTKILIATSILAVGLVAGCASVPMAGADADAKAKTFVAPSDGHANLYIYRSESMGGAIKMPLLLDNMSIGDTGPHTYAVRQVTPGKHTVVSKTEQDVAFDIDAQAGQNYYVWQEVKMGVWAARSALHLVDEKTGEEAVMQCKLIQ
jgi:Protein of unknown function (DUF2846)